MLKPTAVWVLLQKRNIMKVEDAIKSMKDMDPDRLVDYFSEQLNALLETADKLDELKEVQYKIKVQSWEMFGLEKQLANAKTERDRFAHYCNLLDATMCYDCKSKLLRKLALRSTIGCLNRTA